jgi:hypothetical protein
MSREGMSVVSQRTHLFNVGGVGVRINWNRPGDLKRRDV